MDSYRLFDKTTIAEDNTISYSNKLGWVLKVLICTLFILIIEIFLGLYMYRFTNYQFNVIERDYLQKQDFQQYLLDSFGSAEMMNFLLDMQHRVKRSNHVSSTTIYPFYVRHPPPPGAPGPAGPPGLPGLQGPKGEPGINGVGGTPGQKGELGEKGNIGDAGIKGDKGDYGLPGPKGDQGSKGETGSPGLIGSTGANGETGQKGGSGQKGESGGKGNVGDPGMKGERGDVGPPGTKGDKGSDGAPGIKGEQGLKGEKGYDGLSGPIGLPGQKGEQGEKGSAATTINRGGCKLYSTTAGIYSSDYGLIRNDDSNRTFKLDFIVIGKPAAYIRLQTNNSTDDFETYQIGLKSEKSQIYLYSFSTNTSTILVENNHTDSKSDFVFRSYFLEIWGDESIRVKLDGQEILLWKGTYGWNLSKLSFGSFDDILIIYGCKENSLRESV